MKTKRRAFIGGVSAAALSTSYVAAPYVARAQKKYDDGASDTEIKIGHTCPYSGPASAYGVNGKAIVAYFNMINDKGGINGRKVNLISLDDGYSPPKTVELIRQLVEQDKVLCTHNTLGTPTNTAIHKYMNAKKVPHLYLATGASKWGDPKHFPWTMGFQPDYHTEAVIYAKHILANVKDAKIGVLMQNDDYGKDYWEGFKDGLGKEANRVVKHVTYEITEPTVDSQIIQIKAADANVFFNIATPKFAAQAMRKVADLGWKPVHYVNNVSASVGSVMKPAGFDNVQGILTAVYVDGSDRSDLGRPSRHGRVQGVDGQVPSDRAPRRPRQRQRLYRVLPDGRDAAALRRRAHPRQRHEAGDELPEVPRAHAAAGHHRHDQPDRLLPDPGGAAARFKGQSWELFGEILSAESA